ncbi:MAG: hypothetical protein HYV26_19230, partial [Candidatus Hydrogenedentes bacterium]|nr:hypothetical protein [Candidatus Hydrogenedentota bacterium]
MVVNNGVLENYTLDTAMNQYTATPGVSDIFYDDEGNLSSSGVRAKVYTYDLHDRLTGYIEAAGRTLEAFDGSLGAEYEQLLGTWAIVSGSLKQTDAAT